MIEPEGERHDHYQLENNAGSDNPDERFTNHNNVRITIVCVCVLFLVCVGFPLHDDRDRNEAIGRRVGSDLFSV